METELLELEESESIPSAEEIRFVALNDDQWEMISSLYSSHNFSLSNKDQRRFWNTALYMLLNKIPGTTPNYPTSSSLYQSYTPFAKFKQELNTRGVYAKVFCKLWRDAVLDGRLPFELTFKGTKSVSELTEEEVAKILRDCMQRLEKLPSVYLYKEFVMRALRFDKEIIKNSIPIKEIYDICLEVVKEQGSLLEVVPEEFLSKEMCNAALRENEWAIRYVPDNIKTFSMCMEVVKRDGRTLRHVPLRFRTRPLCEAATLQNPLANEHVPTGIMR